MKVKNSLQVESLPNGVIPRILVSYYRTIMEIEEYNLVYRLITDLRSVDIDVLLDEIQDINIPLPADLQSYDWILLVQTKDVSSSALVKERLMQTLAQDGRQHLQGILHVFVSAPRPQAPMSASDMPNTFDVGIDYQRAFAGIALTIHPDNQTLLYGIERGAAASPIVPPGPFSNIFPDGSFRSRHIASLRHPLSILFIILAVVILLGVIVIHSFALSATKTAATRTTVTKITTTKTIAIKTITSNHHTNLATATATATTTPEALYIQVTSRTPVINDSLQSQSADQWDVTQQQGVSCAFTNGSYHASILPPYKLPRRHACMAEGPVFANFALQVDMKLLQGDVGGMVFRANGRSSYYWFSLDDHGCYRLVFLATDGQIRILSDDQRSCLPINMQNTNQLTALAQGSNIYLYINGRFINQFSDPSLTKGGIGLVAIKRTLPTDVAFNNLKVWQLT
jgi:hypothetical protein